MSKAKRGEFVRFLAGKKGEMEMRLAVLPETKEALIRERNRLVTDGDKVETPESGPGVPSVVNVVNRVLCGFLGLPPDQRRRLMEHGREILERRQKSAEAIEHPWEGEPSTRRGPVPPDKGFNMSPDRSRRGKDRGQSNHPSAAAID